MKIINFLFYYFVIINISFAEQIIVPKYKIKQPIKVSADNMLIYYKKGEAYLTGHVVTIQGDLEISAEKMYINFSNISGGNWKIKNIKYENKVIVNSSYIMKGEVANLNFQKETLIMEGNVTIIKDKDEIKGEKLIYDFAAGDLKIMGNNSNRSRAIINIK